MILTATFYVPSTLISVENTFALFLQILLEEEKKLSSSEDGAGALQHKTGKV